MPVQGRRDSYRVGEEEVAGSVEGGQMKSGCDERSGHRMLPRKLGGHKNCPVD